MGRIELPEDERDAWSWIRNPLPPSTENRDFQLIRRSLNMPDSEAVVPGGQWDNLSDPDRARVKRLFKQFPQNHNPFIRYIVRRTREYLESTIDPETNEPYLKPVKVELYGESADEAIQLPL